MIKEHDRIVLKTAIAGEGLEAGDVGTVVHVYRDGLAYEVEFTTLNGDTAAVVTVEAAQVRPVHEREITHARELQPAWRFAAVRVHEFPVAVQFVNFRD